jgi:hypothetical protein
MSGWRKRQIEEKQMPLAPHPTDPDKMVYVKREYDLKIKDDYQRGFIDGMQKQMQSSVDKAVNKMSRQPWADLVQGVRVEGDFVIVKVKGGNDAARELCAALIEEINK